MTLVRSLALIGLLVLGATQAIAQTTTVEPDVGDLSDDVVITADELYYDEDSDTVIASGNVEISQGERVLLADQVKYRQTDGIVSAAGNISLLEPGGEVLFADSVELTDDLRDGVIRRLSVLLTDNSRMVANGARRSNGNRTVMRKAIYSPCDVCQEDRTRAPLWQVKAGTIVHDQEAHDIIYYDASFELFGIPVAYSPYFRHADPTVKRRSGFLAPTYGNSTALGFEVTTPYFWNIAPHRDATFSPRFTTDEGVVLAGEYRELTQNGRFEFDASLTYTDARDDEGVLEGGDEFRGHIFGEGEFDIDPIWQWGFDLQRALDDSYLSRYRIFSEDTLITNVFAEGYNHRSFASANGYWFQGLEAEDEDDQIPIVLPLLDVNFISEPNYAGGYLNFDANVMVLERLNGTDSRRLSVAGGWNRPLVTDGGHVFRFGANLRGDIYHVENLVDPAQPSGDKETEIVGRVLPELSLEWRFPLVARTGTIRQVVEPIVQALVSPYGGNPADIPNEDSQDFEFDHTNLFSNNRFTGFDRVEGGPRVNYGVRLGFYGEGGGRTTILLGQSARLKEDDTFDAGSGLENNLSDYVGRIFIQPSSFLDFAYRFRLDRDNFTARRNEVDLSLGPEWLRGVMGYAQLEEQIASVGTTTFANREEIVLSGSAKFLDHWTFSAGTRRDLAGDGNTISWDTGLSYQDECILIDTRLRRTFTEDRDIEPETNFIVRFQLKHLG